MRCSKRSHHLASWFFQGRVGYRFCAKKRPGAAALGDCLGRHVLWAARLFGKAFSNPRETIRSIRCRRDQYRQRIRQLRRGECFARRPDQQCDAGQLRHRRWHGCQRGELPVAKRHLGLYQRRDVAEHSCAADLRSASDRQPALHHRVVQSHPRNLDLGCPAQTRLWCRMPMRD